MIKTVFLLVIFFIWSHSKAQNLISNPSFEDTITNIWTSATQVCKNSPLIICSSVDSGKGSERINFKSADRTHCVFLSLFQCNTNWSEYLIQEGLTLEKGKRYEISFYITPSDSCGKFAKEIEVVFCNTSFVKSALSCSTPGKIFSSSSLKFDISEFKLTGQEGKWKKLSATFIAEGNETTMLIGRFFKKKVNKTISNRIFKVKPTKRFMKEDFCSADYYLDNFSLAEVK